MRIIVNIKRLNFLVLMTLLRILFHFCFLFRSHCASNYVLFGYFYLQLTANVILEKKNHLAQQHLKFLMDNT